MKNHVFALLFCFITFSCYCQKETQEQKSNKPEGLTEKQAYKLLYENQKEANSSILNTIYFALSGIAAIAIAIVFFQWTVNTKKVNAAKDEAIALVGTKTTELLNIKDNEIKQLQQALQQVIADKVTDLNNQFKDFENRVQNEIQSRNKQLTGEFEKLIAIYNENLSAQIKSLEKVMDERAVNNTEKISIFEKLIADNMNINLQKYEILKQEIDHLDAELARVNAIMWKRTGMTENGLMYHIREAILNFDLDSPILSISLSNIKECLQEVKRLTNYNSTSLNNLIAKFPKNHKDIKSIKEIETLAKTLPVKD